MASQPDRLLKIEVTVNASQPKLLEGLDVWLRLGLISDDRVRRLCQIYLTCLLPEPAVTLSEPEVAVAAASSTSNDFDTAVVETPRPSPLLGMWQSLKDELSVRWLLFLGVFLVVVSSGVLAATQWEKFPAVGQYSVLWAYTLIFWFSSFWAGRQQNLQLTAQTLRLVTLLLVPVNFWAMDSFGLWHHPWEWLVVALAAFTLTANAVLHPAMRSYPARYTSNSLLVLLLSYLHWGWQWSGFPLVAVYIGMVGTAILLPRGRGDAPMGRRTDGGIGRQEDGEQPVDPRTGRAIVIYALTVLLGRGIFIAHLPIPQLGLAIGICGWLFARLGQLPETTTESAPSLQARIWEGIGGSLLLIGWLVSVKEAFPVQATAVSGLSLWFFYTRLQRDGLRRDLLAIFAIGLQAHWLVWRLLPGGWQREILAFFTQLTDSQNLPTVLLSLALFPYLIGMVLLTDKLKHGYKQKLVRFAEKLTLCFGWALTLISLLNPTVRSLNLLLSTIALAVVTFRWTPTRTGLVYLTHISGLLTLASAIDWLFPNSKSILWATILLVAMVLEWGFSSLPVSLLPSSPIWQRSAWHLGFVLSGLSYLVLWHEAYPYGVIDTPAITEPMLLWLLTPLVLTIVASCTDEPRRRQASGLSVFTLGIAQALALLVPGVRLIGLSFATGLMLANTRYLRHWAAAAITVGFGLSFIGMVLWEGIPGLARLSAADWFLVGAIAIIILWILRSLLQQRPGTLASLYAQACDNWAVYLCKIELLMLALQCIGTYLALVSPSWEYLTASILTGVAILYRYWRQPTDSAVYSINWVVGLSTAEAVILAGGSLLELATANIILGLATLFVSDWWLAQQRRERTLSSVEIMPLPYVLLGLGLRLGYFTNWTGLLTLGAALTGIGVGRRREEWKALTYLSLAGISAAWYELVIYPMLQAQGGAVADALTILAGVAVAIAFAYRLLAWFWQSRTNQRLFRLSVAEIKITAHIHWAIGTLLMMLVVMTALSTTAPLRLTGLAIALSLLLAAYALVQGRNNPNPNAAREWVYIGLIEVAATYASARLIWTELNVLDSWLAIVACGLACTLYELPWHRLGWIKAPWQRSSLVLPILTVLTTLQIIPTPSLLLVAGFYAWIAKRSSNIRLTYLSVALIDWAIVRWFSELGFNDLLWYVTPFGLSLLYIAQFDPHLKQPNQRGLRHVIRLVSSGVICGIAFWLHRETGFLPGIIGAIAIFAGLAMRVRAFLYIGTVTFLGTAFYQLIVLMFRYSFVKWVVGLIVGIIFIGMAANFETRREQISSALHISRTGLSSWE